jgi:type II secretory pathway component PulF
MDSWFPTFRGLTNRHVPLPSIWPPYTTDAQRRSLLRLIAVAMEENLPLGPLIESWAGDERGPQRSRLVKLARLLKSGRPLEDAVEEIPGILREEHLLAIRFDAQMGTRTAAMRQMLDDSEPVAGSRVHRVRRDLFYVATVCVIGLLFVVFLNLKIIPVFQKVMSEFSMPPPAVFEWSLDAARLLARFWWVGAIAFFALIWCMLSTRAGRFIRHSIFGRLLAPLRELHASDVLQKIGIASQAGRPLSGALATLARYHFAPTIRHKLLFVRNEVELGAEVFSSMSDVGLLSPADLRVLKTADRVGNRPWVLKQLATVKESRTRRQLARAAEFVLPGLVLLVSGLVLVLALTIFTPLVTMIQGLLLPP